MSLGIEGATIGYDSSNLTALIQDINTQVIPDCATTLRNQVSSARSQIDTVWVGASADAFKDKLEKDVATLCSTLEEMGKSIEGELNTAGANVEGYDSDLAEQIKNWE